MSRAFPDIKQIYWGVNLAGKRTNGRNSVARLERLWSETTEGTWFMNTLSDLLLLLRRSKSTAVRECWGLFLGFAFQHVHDALRIFDLSGLNSELFTFRIRMKTYTLNHLLIQIISLSGSLAHSSKHRKPTCRRDPATCQTIFESANASTCLVLQHD